MQLIDKDALLDGLINDDPKHILLYISHFPTVDPVKHRKWKWIKTLNRFTGAIEPHVMCSGCKHTQKTASAYCGRCGARMDGGDI